MQEIHAITLDLDDTLWPVVPVIRAAEETLWQHIETHYPAVSARYDQQSIVAIRDAIAAEQPDIVHDLTRLRLATLTRAFRNVGASGDAAADAMSVFLEARNAVSFFPDALHGLRRIAARIPILAVSNGNADIHRTGLADILVGSMGAIEAGCAKPHPEIFLKACARLGTDPENTLHVGDHPEQDVLGAARAGLPTAWINRKNALWTHPGAPDLIAVDMLDLSDRLFKR